jgi:very-short-patch-repair endonuclease
VSQLESELEFQLKAVGLRPEREFRFCPYRRWRADFAFPAERVLVECEGGHWTNGRHVRGKGYERDMEKYNAAQELGFSVLRYSGGMIRSGEARQQIERVVITRVPF